MNEILTELKKYYGNDAEFREGQAEAIMGVLQGKNQSRKLVAGVFGYSGSIT